MITDERKNTMQISRVRAMGKQIFHEVNACNEPVSYDGQLERTFPADTDLVIVKRTYLAW